MSENTINLLPRSAVKSVPRRKFLNLLRALTVIAVSFLFITSLSAFFVGRVVSPDAERKQEQKVLADFSPLGDSMAKLLFTHDRLLEIGKILNTRTSLDAKIGIIQSFVPQAAGIDSLRIDKTSVEITVSSASLRRIDEFLANLSGALDRGNTIRAITIQGVGYNGKGEYFVSAKMTLL
ncbi:MAG: hypothetical protein A3J69_00560 [Candidatus Levybacteria bacterium RIFCSPHIGHO2_02_FULL_42_12]|nr:MAG: hypothetical protein A2698_00280 [Candidatus Levybacteria bacterium RIFCSPHIGHO2_01_FULL_42_15]OGH30872.1 MAG: hypothetical protein A3J69_00560 [Candidatus Levybacteria bacterium RIFCSPHIGHO2_02_FULL_42_12]OGH42112.1 MAG: hypothetical protein A3B53_00870 [Candidatus Levybacteria bacterium RIFCSPLOWO2_01_FULL_42_15]